jgi:hypothetical protein
MSDALSMIGIEPEQLIANLETLRRRLCEYGPDAERCDCKYGASGRSEQSGCPELRLAIEWVKGNADKVQTTRQLFEDSAANTLRRIRQVLREEPRDAG